MAIANRVRTRVNSVRLLTVIFSLIFSASLLLVLASLPTQLVFAQVDTQWELQQSTLTYHVSHPLHQVEGVSHAARGKGVCHAGQCDFSNCSAAEVV